MRLQFIIFLDMLKNIHKKKKKNRIQTIDDVCLSECPLNSISSFCNNIANINVTQNTTKKETIQKKSS